MLTMLRDNEYRISTTLELFGKTHGFMPFKTKNGLKGWLCNPVLRGGLGYKYDRAPKKKDPDYSPRPTTNKYKEVVWDIHEALITHEEFALIERHLEMNRNRWGKNTKSSVKLLTGICTCGSCGQKMSYRSSRWRPVIFCQNVQCENRYKTVREELVTDPINQAIAHRLATLRTSQEPETPEVTRLRQEIAEITSRNDPDFKEALDKKKAKLHSLLSKPSFAPEIVERLKDPDFWQAMSEDELRRTYLLLLGPVRVYSRDRVEVGFQI
jgi:hypothetical protein